MANNLKNSSDYNKNERVVDTNRRQILCVGMCVLDVIHLIDKYPEEDSDTRASSGRWQRGGNASNNCTVLSLLGENCEYLGTFSNNEMFKFVIHDFSKYGINLNNCVYYDDCEAPISSVLLLQEKGTRTIVHSNPNLISLTYEDFMKCDLNDYKWIHFEARESSETIKMMKEIYLFNQNLDAKGSNNNKITISLDLEKEKLDNLSLVKYAEYVFLGRDFATFINCTNKKEAVYELRKLTCDGYTIICPWGTDGIAVLNEHNIYKEFNIFRQNDVKDTLGAGDTFCASTIYALANNNNLDIAIRFASTISGLKVGFFGYDELKNKFHGDIEEFLDKFNP